MDYEEKLSFPHAFNHLEAEATKMGIGAPAGSRNRHDDENKNHYQKAENIKTGRQNMPSRFII